MTVFQSLPVLYQKRKKIREKIVFNEIFIVLSIKKSNERILFIVKGIKE